MLGFIERTADGKTEVHEEDSGQEIIGCEAISEVDGEEFRRLPKRCEQCREDEEVSFFCPKSPMSGGVWTYHPIYKGGPEEGILTKVKRFFAKHLLRWY